MRRIALTFGLPAGLLAAGCATVSPTPPVPAAPVSLPPSYQQVANARPSARAGSPVTAKPTSTIIQAADTQPAQPEKDKEPTKDGKDGKDKESTKDGKEKAVTAPPPAPSRVRPAYARLETLPIDLPTVIRLVNESSPAVGIARASVRAAQARLDLAEVQWLPNLSAGVAYTRFDGQTQNQAGSVFGVSRGNLFAGGGPALTLDLADAVYRPLVERRSTAAEQFRSQAVLLGAELDAVSAYLDLVQAHALLEINTDTLAKAEAMVTAARNAKEAKLDRTAGDVNRAQTEVLFRQTERADLEARVGVASARLARQLLLQPNVRLVPADAVVAPVTLVDPSSDIDGLLNLAVANRPDLAAYREAIAAALARVRRQEVGPLLPKVTVSNQTGTFGGGVNGNLRDFSSRNALNVQLYWELRHLGFGNRAEANERRALVDLARYQLTEAQARAVADIVEAAQLAAARYESLDLAERAVKEATELYRITKEGVFNVVDAKNLFDALRPLQAIQALNQARQTYLNAVIEFNRAQYRLLTATGNPPVTPTPRPRP